MLLCRIETLYDTSAQSLCRMELKSESYWAMIYLQVLVQYEDHWVPMSHFAGSKDTGTSHSPPCTNLLDSCPSRSGYDFPFVLEKCFKQLQKRVAFLSTMYGSDGLIWILKTQ